MSYQPYRPARKDMSDCTAEKHCFVKQEYVKSAGSIVKVLGTDTEDEEADDCAPLTLHGAHDVGDVHRVGLEYELVAHSIVAVR